MKTMRKSCLVWGALLLVCALTVRALGFIVSISGCLTGFAYCFISLELYAQLLRLLLSSERRPLLTVSLIALKIAALGSFVFILAKAEGVFLFSALAGFAPIIPASFQSMAKT